MSAHHTPDNRRYTLQSFIVKNFCISAMGLALARALTALSVSFILLWVPPAEYGIWGLITSFMYLLTLCNSLGLRQFFAIEYFHVDKTRQKQLVMRILMLYSCSALLCSLLLSLNFSWINTRLFFNKLTWPLFTLMLVGAFLSLCNDLFMQQIKYRSQAHLFSLLTLMQTSITAGVTIMLVALFHAGITGLLIGLCVGLSSIFVYAFYSYYHADYHQYFVLPDRTDLIALKKSSIFMPGLIAGWVITSHASWVLSSYTSPYYLGIYTFAARCSYIIELIIIQALNCSYIPATLLRLSESKNNNRHQIEQVNKKTMLIYMLALLMLIGLLALGARPLVSYLVPACYCEHLGCLWLMLIGSVFLIGSYFTFIYIQFHRHTKALACISFIPALLSIIGNYLFIPRFSIYGCAAVYAFSYALYFSISLIYNYHLANKYHP